MIRQYADEETQWMIDEALTPKGQALADTWDDDEAWEMFESARQAERR